MPVAGLERKTNPQLVELILELRRVAHQHESGLWTDIAERLSRPHRLWAQVNLDRLGLALQQDEIALVPGKVLSTGTPARGLKVAAVNFSENARAKIEQAGGKCLSIQELTKLAPKGQGVRIIA
jgi:large subunit ribosomal protein L18e